MMVAELLAGLAVVQRELLLFASICFLLGALDDLLFDLLWIVHSIKRRLRNYRRYPKAIVEALPQPHDHRPLAIFVPAWQEDAVIGSMLQRCSALWQHRNYRIYVGCYPNDEPTIAAAARAARGEKHVRIILCDHHGPTSKADCLNRLWRAACQDELLESKQYKAVILQDAEDLVHPKALELFDHLIDRAALVQLPVIPRRAAGSRWVAGHYGDEFAEMHGKQMVLREALGVALPSAGVGCAFGRAALGTLSARTRGKPFDAESMTEDYELGLQLTTGKPRGIFARMQDRDGQWVATQEFFPDTLADAIRQKSRWMTGIALSGWDRLGWQRCWRENWMRMRDRKATLAAIVLALAYLAFILTGLLMLTDHLTGYAAPALPDGLKLLLLCNGVFLLWKLALKAYFVFRLYGLSEAILSFPRTIVANLINILAAGRAMYHYFKSLKGTPLRWEKTRHFHPNSGDVRLLKPHSRLRPEPAAPHRD